MVRSMTGYGRARSTLHGRDITVEVRGYLDSTNMWGPQYINIQSGNSGGQVEVSGLTPSGSVTIEKVNNTEIQPVNTDNATYTW